MSSFPGAALYDKIGVTELNENILNSMNNSWYKKSYIQELDCEYILLKKAANMFDPMEITESIYEGLVEPYYKKTTWVDSNCAGHIRNKRGGSALYKTRPVTGESTGKRRKKYVDCSTRE